MRTSFHLRMAYVSQYKTAESLHRKVVAEPVKAQMWLGGTIVTFQACSKRTNPCSKIRPRFQGDATQLNSLINAKQLSLVLPWKQSFSIRSLTELRCGPAVTVRIILTWRYSAKTNLIPLWNGEPESRILIDENSLCAH